VVINRYRESPHPRVTFANDFSKRLDPQPGTKVVYARTIVDSDRDPGFLGIMNPENDAVYIPLKKGRNELVLAVSELGGGWGFICRLEAGEIR